MPSLHERAKEVFVGALEHRVDERRRFVVEVCGPDTELLVEVQSLLRIHEETGSRPALDSTTGHPPVASSEPAPLPIKTGDVFAGRYRMVTRIGRGGMGDVWRADDLVLDTPVALKVIQATGPTARDQAINEVRLARQITHPAVCRVFDVGEDAGLVFFSMELVDGQDFATLLKRIGRLPVERVLDVARQLCAGLAAAHAQGVLHRDLKPANLLVDNRGDVIITDFGIAILREHGAEQPIVGTPGYMAPEQLTAAVLTERTDIYALGVILYELVVGQHPFDRRLNHSAEPPAPSSRVAGIDARLERVIMRALKAEPDERWPSAAAMVDALGDTSKARVSGDPRGRGRRWTRTVAIVAGAAVVAALAGVFLTREAGETLTAQDTVVLADFANTTGDPVFDGALKVALAVALEQSPFLKVFPDERMRDTLMLMGRTPDTTVTRTVAREIAQREQLKALIVGSVAGLGRNFVLTLEAVNAETSDVMAREQVEAGRKEDVLTALGGAAARLRNKLGESLASVQRFDVPLARATTSSLDALHAYSLALDDGSINPRVEAVAHLRHAIELDPNFALAMALLATMYSNTGQTALAPEFAKKAFDLRDRVSERERFFIAYRYHRDGTQNWTEALDLSRSWTATYPREAFAFNALGQSLQRFGAYAESVAPLRESIRLDPRFEAPYANLAGSLMAIERYDGASEVLQQASAAGVTSFPIRRMNFLLAFIRGDDATMTRMVDESLGVGVSNAASGWQAHALAFSGQLTAAHDQFQVGIGMAQQGGFGEVAGQLWIEDAESHAVLGACGPARAEVKSGLQLSRDNYSLERAIRALALCGDESQAAELERELVERFPDATLTVRVLLPIARAIAALQRADANRVLELLEPVRSYDRLARAEYWPEYLRGHAHLHLKDGRSAAASFASILEHRGENPTVPVYQLARLGLARAHALAGDVPSARLAYSAFLEALAGADPDLPPVQDARRELARLE